MKTTTSLVAAALVGIAVTAQAEEGRVGARTDRIPPVSLCTDGAFQVVDCLQLDLVRQRQVLQAYRAAHDPRSRARSAPR